MKRYEEENIKRIGMRIKSARALSGYNQSEFCEKYGLSLGAFKTWESGKFAPRMTNIEELCRCFKNEGLFNVTTSWFLNGDGPAPTHAIGSITNNFTDVRKDISNQVLDELELFKQHQIKLKNEVLFTLISDDLMLPYFTSGDVVAGIRLKEPPSSLEIKNKPFLIESRPNEYLVRWCFFDGKDLYFKAPLDALVYRVDYHKMGKVLWHRVG